jgi:glutamine---fructose-6-phosphate transaminase (isomerizing)
LKEIQSQPEVWGTVLRQLAEGSMPMPDPGHYDEVIFTGCGSTFYLSLWAARHCQALLDVRATAMPASELILAPDAWLQKSGSSLLVAVSRSGETTETVMAVEAIRESHGGDLVVVTCNPGSSLARSADWVVGVPAGREKSVVQTRSFTSMMLGVSWLLAGPVQSTDDPGGPLLSGIEDTLERAEEVASEDIDRFFFLGTGERYGLASEAMLKLKEMALLHTEAYHFLEFRHGPMALVDDRSMVVGLLGGDRRELDVLDHMRSLGARTAALAPEGSADPDRVDILIGFGNERGQPWGDVAYLPFAHMLGYSKAMQRGLDPDNPINLGAVVRL